MTRSLAGQMEGLRRREDSSSSNVPKSLKNREKQITKMMAIIFATFLMTYIPGYLVKQVRFFAQAAIILGQSMIYHFTFWTFFSWNQFHEKNVAPSTKSYWIQFSKKKGSWCTTLLPLATLKRKPQIKYQKLQWREIEKNLLGIQLKKEYCFKV